MYDFNKVPPNGITVDWILSKVNQWEIFRYYFGPFELKKSYSSKFRTDKDPSTGFYISRSGTLIYNDLTKKEKHNCFSFVQKMHGNCRFPEALGIIARDFGLVSGDSRKVPDKVIQEARELENTARKATLIQFVPDKWTRDNMKYWRFYEFNQDELNDNLIFPVKHLYINKSLILNKYNEPRYAYLVKDEDGNDMGVKIYQPYSKDMKWRSSVPLVAPFGMHNFDWANGSNTVYITKSLKDLVVLRKIFPAVFALQNESEAAFTEELQKKVCNTFEHRIIVFDADPPGVDACKLFNNKGFGYLNTPNDEYKRRGIKDPSDYVRYYGLDALKEFFASKNYGLNGSNK